MFIHDDPRRTLHELTGDFKTCKAIVAKEACVLGNHHHNKKTEAFMLVVGKAKRVIVGDHEWGNTPAPHEWIVPPGTFHVFDLEPGSVLVGTATAEFDPQDEIPGRP